YSISVERRRQCAYRLSIIGSISSSIICKSSMKQPALAEVPTDRLSALLERFRVRAHLFHAGPLCGITHFPAVPGRAFLHVLRRGSLEVAHPAGSGTARRSVLCEPTLLLYPRPLEHHFHNAPREGSDFVCATLEFDGGARHPL